jgi:hypothetical protein
MWRYHLPINTDRHISWEIDDAGEVKVWDSTDFTEIQTWRDPSKLNVQAILWFPFMKVSGNPKLWMVIANRNGKLHAWVKLYRAVSRSQDIHRKSNHSYRPFLYYGRLVSSTANRRRFFPRAA